MSYRNLPTIKQVMIFRNCILKLISKSKWKYIFFNKYCKTENNKPVTTKEIFCEVPIEMTSGIYTKQCHVILVAMANRHTHRQHLTTIKKHHKEPVNWYGFLKFIQMDPWLTIYPLFEENVGDITALSHH